MYLLKKRVFVVGTPPDYIDYIRKNIPGRVVFITDPDVMENFEFFIKSSFLDNFAERIAAALDKFLPIIPECRICMEPGRWICHECMHILIKVVDVKYKDLVITDAGTNAVGWERFENDYFPVINLTHPGSHEQSCHILGALCTPHDVWGYSYHGT